MEKMGIYELFTVLGAGMLSCVLWYLALGLPYFEKLLSEDNLIIIVMGVLIINCPLCQGHFELV